MVMVLVAAGVSVKRSWWCLWWLLQICLRVQLRISWSSIRESITLSWGSGFGFGVGFGFGFALGWAMHHCWWCWSYLHRALAASLLTHEEAQRCYFCTLMSSPSFVKTEQLRCQEIFRRWFQGVASNCGRVCCIDLWLVNNASTNPTLEIS